MQSIAIANVAPATVQLMYGDAQQEWRKERLKALADKYGGNAELGRALGYRDGAYVGQMLGGLRPISEKTIERAESLPGAAGWFAQNLPIDVREALPQYEMFGTGVVVPLLANSASMGVGVEQQHDDVIVGRLTLSPTWISKSLKLSRVDNLRFIHGYGDSMEPTFADGDVLLVDAGVRDVKVDGIYVLSANHRLYIKRVRQRMDATFEISSDNATVKTVDVLDGSKPVDVLGRVVWVWNGKKM